MSWPDELLRLFPRLRKLQPPFYVVGGAIRDLLAERTPADVDIACTDPRSAAEKIGSRVIRLGDQEHLSAFRVVSDGHVYDFAQLLDDDISADLTRRDFTVNAMAVDFASGELLDPHDGRGDLRARVVRMVDASNFDDDPLRTLKGVRMAVKYGMTIEEATLAAIRERAQRIDEIAAERVTYELSAIFNAGAFRKAVSLLDATALAEPLGLQTREVVADDVSEAGAYAILVPAPRDHGRRWRWSESMTRSVLTLQQLVASHDRISLYDAGREVAMQLPPVLRALGRDDALDLPDFDMKPLLTGDEISELCGLREGREVGRRKRLMLEAQLRGEIGSRDEAVSLVRGARE
jgi:hypothetical protein